MSGKIIELDATIFTPREINSKIKEYAKKGSKILIKNPNAMHYLVAGVVDKIDIEIDDCRIFCRNHVR